MITIILILITMIIMHDHHHSIHLKETNSSSSLAFPVLWVRVQSLQHVKRLVVMMILMMKVMMMISNAWS